MGLTNRNNNDTFTLFLIFKHLSSEPDVRGILTATNCIAVALGYLLNYSLANMLPWRMMAFIYIAMPVASAVTMFFVRFIACSVVFE